MSKRKKTSPAQAPASAEGHDDKQSMTTESSVREDVLESAVVDQGSPVEEPPGESPSSTARGRAARRKKAAPSRAPETTTEPHDAAAVVEPEPAAEALDETHASPLDETPSEHDDAPSGPDGAELHAPADADTHADADAEGEADRGRDELPPDLDSETTLNLGGEALPFPERTDLDAPTVAATSEELAAIDGLFVQRRHLRGLLEALIFASDSPIKPNELAKLASAPIKQVKELLAELKHEYASRGMHLDEIAGGWCFRTSAQYAPFIRDLTKQKPVRLTRAQVETLAIIAYRQPITRPEIDDVRGVDSGPVLKLLLERDLIRILGKRDEPGRPLIYGTTATFLEFFGLRSLKDLPTLREFTELTDESRQVYEDELGEPPHEGSLGGETMEAPAISAAAAAAAEDAAAGVAAAEASRADAGRTDAEARSAEHAAQGSARSDDERAPAESMRVPIGGAPDDEEVAGEDTIATERPRAPDAATDGVEDAERTASDAPGDAPADAPAD